MLKPGMYINDRYEIIEKVGSGGMADVYKARCHRLNRFVAIKVLKAEYSSDASFVLKFRAEAQSAAGLSHPNIVNVYDVGDDDGLHYIVMELVEGITLKSFIERKGRLEVKEAVGISIQIAQGLEAAHDNHIIHRDIKPQNIIISREGKVKVTDFGIAKAATSNTINSNAMGSVHYISPEQARGGYSDEKSDIYSLGVTLYEMLSGTVPFAGENTVSVALLHIQGEATPLRQLNPQVPYSLEQIVAKCMEKKPERRYLSASELIADLKRSIVEPNGGFVKLVAPIIDNSPTINISEKEVKEIKRASGASVADYDARRNSKDRTSVGFEDMEEDEDEDEINPKLDKIFLIGGISVAVILAIIVFVIAGSLVGLWGNNNSGGSTTPTPPTPTVSQSAVPSMSPSATPLVEVTLPEVVGKKLEEAKTLLNEANIKFKFESEVSDEELDKVLRVVDAEGAELSTGAKISPDEVIMLYYSGGPKSVKVPDVTKYTYEQAKSKLESEGFTVSVDYETSETVAVDAITRTEPAADTEVPEGSKIIIWRSSGMPKVVVPSVVKNTAAKAKKAIEKVGLVYKEGDSVYSNEIKKGYVVSQSPSNSTSVDKGSTITVILSKGPEPVVETVYTTGTFTFTKEAVGIPDTADPLEQHHLRAEVIQDGNTIVIVNEDILVGEFPRICEAVTSKSGNKGVLKISLDGKPVGGTSDVTFTKQQ